MQRNNKLLSLFLTNKKRGSFTADANTIFLYDMIVGDDWEAEMFGGVSPKQFMQTLSAMNGTVHIRINSPGGDVFGANAMVQAMREYKGEIIAHVDGLAASAASVIAVNATKVVMAPGSLMMIHNASTLAMGTADDFIEIASLLAKVDLLIADNYSKRAKMDALSFAELMTAETWFTPAEAIDIGLADEIAADAPKATAKPLAAWDLSVFNAAPAPLVTRTTTVTTSTETEVETETVEIISGDPATAPADAINQRVRNHAALMVLKAA